MIMQTRWIERTFKFDQLPGTFPCILERFRGTPARIEELVSALPQEVLTTRVNNKWSIQENAGHLLDLDELDTTRLSDFLSGAETLTAADMQNHKTENARHNSESIENILRNFRMKRSALIEKMDRLTIEQVVLIAEQPRLKTPMRLIDWLYFTSEHDDHHLARMRGLKRGLSA